MHLDKPPGLRQELRKTQKDKVDLNQPFSAEARAGKGGVVLTDRVEAGNRVESGNMNVYTLAALGQHLFIGWKTDLESGF